MNRRHFMQSAAQPLLVPFAILSGKNSVEKHDLAPLPQVEYGSILTAEKLNNLINRVNEISERNM